MSQWRSRCLAGSRWLAGALGLWVIAFWAGDTFAAEGPEGEAVKAAITAVSQGVDRGWVLVAGAMVCLMQAGFLVLEAGCVRQKASAITAMKNVIGWVVGCGAFFFVGWGLMFGHSAGTLVGIDLLFLAGDTAGGHPVGLWVHYLFQLAFAGAAIAIVSGAVAERTSFFAYLIFAVVMTALIYPVVGHWVWGNSYFASNVTLLSQWGFIDFAGSTVVHSVGGWASLIGVMIVGPRLGRFSDTGEVRPMESHSIALAGMGCLMLWFSWWGFNGGSTLALGDGNDVGKIINNTNLGATFGGLAALGHCYFFQGKRDITIKFLGGVLAGLVSVTANCHMISPLGALVIGAGGGILCNWSTELLLKLKLDDPVGAIPVHLFGGLWGTLCVGLFGKESMFPNGHSRIQQIGIQLLGMALVAVFTCAVSYATFKAIKVFLGVRVSPQEEIHGFDIGGEIKGVAAGGDIDEESLRNLMTK